MEAAPHIAGFRPLSDKSDQRSDGVNDGDAHDRGADDHGPDG